jgi:hypothetical protein
MNTLFGRHIDLNSLNSLKRFLEVEVCNDLSLKCEHKIDDEDFSSLVDSKIERRLKSLKQCHFTNISDLEERHFEVLKKWGFPIVVLDGVKHAFKKHVMKLKKSFDRKKLGEEVLYGPLASETCNLYLTLK